MPDNRTAISINKAPMQAFCSWLGEVPTNLLGLQGLQSPYNPSLPVELDALSAVEWGQLVATAQREGLAPMLYWLLSKSGKFSTLPDAVRYSLRAHSAVTRIDNQAIYEELESLANAFKLAEIPCIVLKGGCYALTIYPDTGLRPMGDLDVLVPAARLPEAVQIAQSLCYVDVIPDASPGLRDLLNHEICLKKTGLQSISLEIHHSLVADKTYSYAVPVDWFWEQNEPLSCLFQARFESLRMLAPTAQVLYAAAHAMLQHGGNAAPLRWFYDLDRLVRTYDGRLDWDLLLSQAQKFSWGSALEAALFQTQACFHTPIPDYIRAALSGFSDSHWKLVRRKQILPTTNLFKEYQMLISLNWYGRCRLVMALIAPSPAYMRWRYRIKSSWAIPAYYLIRWWGLLVEVFRSLVSLFEKAFLYTHG
jgi:hypothetical protein